MNMKRFAPIAIVIALLGGLGTVWALQNNNTPAETTVETVATATPTPQEVITYQGVAGETALVTLQATHEVITKDSSFGPMVTSIDGLVADDAHYWGYDVNGEYASVGAHEYEAKEGDVITWKYTAL